MTFDFTGTFNALSHGGLITGAIYVLGKMIVGKLEDVVEAVKANTAALQENTKAMVKNPTENTIGPKS